TASDIAPWVSGYSPGYWKLLTSWIVAPSLLVALIDAFIVYFVGKSMESALGTRRFLALFVGSCALSALFAGVVDPLLMPGAREIVVMGPAGGIAAALVGVVGIAPNRPWIMNWPMKRVMLVLLGLLLAFNLIMPLVSGADIRLSPTRMLWAAGIGALFMLHLKNQGRLPRLDAGPSHAENKEPWSSEPAWRDADDPPAD